MFPTDSVNVERKHAALGVVVASMVIIIGLCLVAAVCLVVLHYNDSKLQSSTAGVPSGGRQEGVSSTPMSTSSPAASSPLAPRYIRTERASGNDRAPAAAAASTTVTAAWGSGLRRRAPLAAGSLKSSGSSCAAVPSGDDATDWTSSLFDTQESMDSATVQEILGSVEACQIHGTQALLQSFYWDMEELLQSELGSQGRAF